MRAIKTQYAQLTPADKAMLQQEADDHQKERPATIEDLNPKELARFVRQTVKQMTSLVSYFRFCRPTPI